MTRLGPRQRDIVEYLRRGPVTGSVICSTTKAPEFGGLDLEQVERSLAGLIRRGIVRREGIRYILVEK